MIIGYPVTDEASLIAVETVGNYPFAVFSDDTYEGLLAGWHGGIHLQIPPGTGGGGDVCAIADGTVVAYRAPSRKVDGRLLSPDDPSLADSPLNYLGWTDDGFLLVKHEKVCGEGRDVVFYSLYMHLSEIFHLTCAPRSLSYNPLDPRKGKSSWIVKTREPIGRPGMIEGSDHQIHFEIFTSDADFHEFFKREQGHEGPWGDIFFIIPEQRPWYRDLPLSGTKGQADGMTPIELRISMRSHGDSMHFYSLDENGIEMESWSPQNGETDHDIREEKARKQHNHGEVGTGQPALSHVDKSTEQHWHFLPMVGGWVDFADPNVKMFTDADFLSWQWQTIRSGEAGFDPSISQCLVRELITAIDDDANGLLSALEIKDWKSKPENQVFLRSLIVESQSEWAWVDGNTRWEWVKTMWSDPISHRLRTLRQKRAWVLAQKGKAQSDLPKLEARSQRAKDWKARLEQEKAEAENNLKQAQRAMDDAEQKRNGFSCDVSNQRSDREAPANGSVGQSVRSRKKELLLAKERASLVRQQAEQRGRQLVEALKRTEAWVAREETKIAASKEILANADPMLATLDDAIQITAKERTDPADAKLAEESYKHYKAYLKALQFPFQGFGFPKEGVVWHFHPLEFIDFFNKCHYMTHSELGIAGRHLTEGEIREAKTVFGDKIDYSKPLLIQGKWAWFQGQNVGMSPNGNIYFPDLKADYSKTSRSETEWFIHEMTHVYQFQRGNNLKTRTFFLHLLHYLSFTAYDPYFFDYTPGQPLKKAFDEYNLEQQGDIAVLIYRKALPNIIP